MAAMFGGGDNALGQLPLEQWFFETPVCTRYWTTAVVLTGILVQCQVLSPFQLFYSYRAVFANGQYWRLLTTFVYFGPLSFNLLFHIFFIQRYARMLEESSPSRAHFAWLLAYAATTLICLAPLLSVAFLGSTLSSTLVYIWARRNPEVQLSFLGLFVFTAPWLPWVMLGLSVVMHGQWPKDELCGIIVGHVWYFFNDIYPSTHNNSRPMDPPNWWRRIFDGRAFDATPTDVPVANPNTDLAAAAVPEVQ